MKLLITGAGGMIAPDLIKRLEGDFELRLSDIVPVESNHHFVRADLANSKEVADAVSGVDAIIHLGAISWEQDPLSEVIPSNIIGAYNIFEEGRKAGVKKIIFASSHHTMGYYHAEDRRLVQEDAIPRPDTFYAVSKLYGEALARMYFERYELKSYCLRIGYYMTPARTAEGFDRYREALILSPDDFAQMVRLCLATKEINFGIYNCISNARDPWLCIRKAREELGYQPSQTVEDLFGDVLPASELTDKDLEWLYGEFKI